MIYLIDQSSVIIVLLTYDFAKLSIMKYDISAIDVELIKEKKIGPNVSRKDIAKIIKQMCLQLDHATGTSDRSDICEGFTRFGLKFYNGHLCKVSVQEKEK